MESDKKESPVTLSKEYELDKPIIILKNPTFVRAPKDWRDRYFQ